jgi:hypothetical protein
MPQFELDAVGEARASGLVRARTPEEAVRQAVGEGPPVEVAPEADLQGWQAVTVGGEASGRVRLHQRMRFRRD